MPIGLSETLARGALALALPFQFVFPWNYKIHWLPLLPHYLRHAESQPDEPNYSPALVPQCKLFPANLCMTPNATPSRELISQGNRQPSRVLLYEASCLLADRWAQHDSHNADWPDNMRNISLNPMLCDGASPFKDLHGSLTQRASS